MVVAEEAEPEELPAAQAAMAAMAVVMAEPGVASAVERHTHSPEPCKRRSFGRKGCCP